MDVERLWHVFERWARLHWPDSVRRVRYDAAIHAVIATCSTPQGQVMFCMSDQAGLGICAQTPDQAAALSRDFAIRQLARDISAEGGTVVCLGTDDKYRLD
jgi:hypothetical protein